MAWPIALVALTALRLAVAATAPLAPDEAYYWVWSRALAPGYLDHPPMIAFWIAAGTALLGDTALGVRLLGPLGAAVGSVMLWDAGRRLFDARAGLAASLLLNATLLLGVGAVTATPDTPLLLFWVAALWAVVRAEKSGDGRWWLLVGLFAGFALLSKYTAALLGLGLALWLMFSARHWLSTRWPWLGGAVALLCFAPVLWWNVEHDWVSFAKQGGRVGDSQGLQLRYLAELLGSQIGLATPLVFGLCVAGTALAVRRWRDPRHALLAALILPGAVLFLWQALGERVQGNWPAILYPAAALAAGALASRWTRSAAGLGFAITAAVYVQASLAPLPLQLPRRYDPTLIRMGGFDALAAEIAARRPAAVVGDDYALISTLAFRLPSGIEVWAAGERWEWFDLPRFLPPTPPLPTDQAWRARHVWIVGADPPSAPILFIRSARRGDTRPEGMFATITDGPVLVRGRGGIEAERYGLHAVEAPQVPLSRLPRPR
jgi:4-amino-4-deoxy-L-arabinose transferase-like glycosyltransferase